ncbi:MBL fold metallo-hydrolase [Pueribacillus theae]|uniref:MBL fold metallo-hydrolase n=1 Tax=Pueribacillus theae TaxID=2171751 RepID=A0A2U1K6V9_9BACI|nr:MBL fold metallo-hydrolase [Pueribacillus theae]PWA13267.1 MBL fold metallo-hydrolase [Pueribacillus theae]
MGKKKPIDLGNRIHLIDGFDLGFENRTGTYVINEEKLTLIETCASPSIPYILQGLEDLHINPEQVEYIIVTHIHLDHAGGAGLLMEKCPNAKLVVHPKGARHMADPSRLIQGAKAVYGEKFEQFFSPILPVPEERILIKGENDTLRISDHCELLFLDTPGHANHHFSIYDPVSNGIFVGDTLGIQHTHIEEFGFKLFLPATSPNQFDPDKTLHSMEKIKKMDVERIYFGHFSVTDQVEEAYRQIEYWLPVYVNTGKEVLSEGKEMNELADRLFDKISERLINEHNVPTDHVTFEILKMDLQVFSMGVMDYLMKKEKSGVK